MNWKVAALGISLVALVVAACSSSDDEKKGTSPCDTGCSKLSSLECASTTCKADCEAGRTEAKCKTEYDAMLNCVVGKGTPVCENGEADFAVPEGACDAAGTAWATCEQGAGGSGGSAGSGGSGGGTPAGCGFTSSDPACNACITGTCASSCATCTSNAACSSLFDCFVACEDDACFSACEDSYPAGIEPLNAFLGCMSNSCSGACSG